jgi:hypothetical protein
MTNPLDRCHELLEQADNDQDPEALKNLHALALDILLVTTRNPLFSCTVKWWEGCRCHGSSGSKTFTSMDIPDMARQLANFEEHAEKGDLDGVSRTVPLTDDEKEELAKHYDLWVDFNNRTRRLKEAVEVAKTVLKAATLNLATETRKFEALKDELTPGAQTLRQCALEVLRKEQAGREGVLAEAEQALALHLSRTP